MKYWMIICLGISCTPRNIGKVEMWRSLLKKSPDAEFVIPNDINSGVKCADYGPGCIRGFTIRLKSIEMIALEFEDFNVAKAEAIRIDGYQYANWVLDDVRGEPILEDFFENSFEAKRPLKQLKTSPDRS